MVITNSIGMKLDLMGLRNVSHRLTENDLNGPFQCYVKLRERRPKGPGIRHFEVAGLPDYTNKLAKPSLVPSRKQKANKKKQ